MNDDPQANDTHEPAPPPIVEAGGRRKRPRRMAGWKLALIICSILVIGALVLAAVLMAALFKHAAFSDMMGQYRVMMECEAQIEQIGAALRRYEVGHEEYPSKIEDLYPDYLASRSLLRCPADPRDADSGPSSYAYTRPKRGASDETAVLVCGRHRVSNSLPPTIIRLMKNGKVVHTPEAPMDGSGEVRGGAVPGKR